MEQYRNRPLAERREMAAALGLNEHTLDRVRRQDYAIDLRTVPQPARDWLERPLSDSTATARRGTPA
ncbi:hypothetical protein [Streptomyces sp. NPDC055506]